MAASWLWLSLPGLALSLGLLALSILRIVRAWRGNLLARLPLVADQVVELPEVGRMVLHAEGPQLSRTFWGLDYALTRVADAAEVALRKVWFRTQVGGWSKVRTQLRRFEVDRPGTYRLQVLHLTPEKKTEGRALVVTRADRLWMTLRVLAIVVTGYFTIGSLVVTVLAFAGPPPA